jgi:hypothetical protein
VDLPKKEEDVEFMELNELSIVGIIGKVTKLLFRKKNICKQRQRLSLLKVTRVELDIIWQDSNEKESATAKRNV